MGRVIALFLILIPIVGAGYGIKLMRDAFFLVELFPYPTLWIQFFAGLLFFLIGLGLMAGFIFHRDKKRGKVAETFFKKDDQQL
ncbi:MULTISPECIES: DUF2627 domain-containing protein [Shouchella]|uniref:DUF2627 domain-containing protein n=3 Tax=Bacillaceae TaxID=186817 RepID=A0A060LZ16_9BACI|nr:MULTISPECIES: DUF2627 domain-containing protein [Bacillaceae]RQW20841.1 DUF2627 domain-containing protein [Bacillus sp. C1-1]AIC95010.1 hypothetical protein BleG1_2434 [Shouchella lehensis G1]KQL57724.1 hypothetical protein AN965_09680 [Alkalicoccobacillus plakortidis]MBG9784149.1 membrane protein [Shouchella lehensis]TES50865.1 DUF2627 domain-containing protein [Shouchella lehensis]